MLAFVVNALICEVEALLRSPRMPRVVPDQREKFENDELFRKLSRESEVRYTGFRDRPIDERRLRLQEDCRQGHADVVFVNSGINLQLLFETNTWSSRPEERIVSREFVDFDRDPDKVYLKSQFIMNGVCVIWKGWIDLHRLDGTAHLEYDEGRAQIEDAILREQIEQYNERLREFEEQRDRHHFRLQPQHQQQQPTTMARHAIEEAEVAQALLDISTPATTTH